MKPDKLRKELKEVKKLLDDYLNTWPEHDQGDINVFTAVEKIHGILRELQPGVMGRLLLFFRGESKKKSLGE